MSIATGIGSMPGADARDYGEAVRFVVGELPDLPFLPELPSRGAPANLAGRAMAILAELGADLQPAGWRLTDAAGIDQRRARSLLAQDLDALQEHAGDWEGRLKIQVAGPWTLAATVERPRGDRVLADHGARRELAQALAEGLRDHLGDVRRRFPGAAIDVQVDEPALPAVLAAQIPTASGFSRHRGVDAATAEPPLAAVFDAITRSGATPLAHCCAAQPPISLLVRAGAQGVSIDLDLLETKDYDEVAGVLDGGRQLLLGVVPSLAPSTERTGKAVTETAVTDRVVRLLDALGLDAGSAGDRLVLTPACGLAGATPAWARQALQLCRKVAANVSAG